MPRIEIVALTPKQRKQLRFNAFAPAVVALVLVFVLGAMLFILNIELSTRPLVRVFVWAGAVLLALVFAFVALHMRNNLLDARDGVAQVSRVELRKKHMTSEAPITCYAEFHGMRSLLVELDVYEQLEVGKRYRVAFSPRTRRCWSVKETPSFVRNAAVLAG